MALTIIKLLQIICLNCYLVTKKENLNAEADKKIFDKIEKLFINNYYNMQEKQ